MVEALYGCQFADCAVDVSYPAHMLKMLNGAPVCEDCVDDMGKVDWLNLEKFVPPEQAKIADLQAKLDKAVEALGLAEKHLRHQAAYIGKRYTGYSFESLGEDMPQIEAAIKGAKA